MAFDTPVSTATTPSDRAGIVQLAVAIGAVALLTLAGAWFFELVLDIKPCPLCLEQRYAYYLATPLAVLTAVLALARVPRSLAVAGFAVLAIAFVLNAALGAYHSGVEWKFWPGPTTCSGSSVDLGRAGGLLDKLDSVKVIRCDDVQWRFLGLSLAGYNVLISLALAGLSAAGLRAVLARR